MGSPLSPQLLFLLYNFFLLTVLMRGQADEATALLSFKASIREDPTGSLSNWNSSSSSSSSSSSFACSWNGVTCRDGSVFSLSLPKKNLVGNLPSSLGSLRNLRHLNLRNNRLFGGLPSRFFAALDLQSLVLYGNFFSGFIPQEIGGLSYLQTLDLSDNLLVGAIPASLTQCKRLRNLVLSHNNFTGSLPPDFGSSLTGLERLDLSYNSFSGSIPSDIAKLTSLNGTLDFSHNQFSGSIPPSLGNLPEKVYIDLTYNNLSGPIPQNVALENRGPTAFIGNPGLCGPPLKNPCSSTAPSANPFLPTTYSPSALKGNGTYIGSSSSRGLSGAVLIAIVLSDVVGIFLIAFVFFYCYRRATASLVTKETVNSNKDPKGRKECTCFRKEESESYSENVEQYELVPLDKYVQFNLDELLKASAFVLGKSRMGIVYKVVMDDGLTLAVRRLGEGGSQRYKEFQTEVEAIGKVRHPNIVTLRAHYWSPDEKLLIYDYIPNGNLSAAISGKAAELASSPLSWEARIKIMKGVAKGLAFLHEFSSKKYVHGDLKPNNILLGLKMEPYISDFGVGRVVKIAGESPLLQSGRIASENAQSQPSDISFTAVVSRGSCYQAPEALRTLRPSQKWDVYSYGVILLELISGRSPALLLDTLEIDLAHWIQIYIEEKKPLVDVLDPVLSHKLLKEDVIIAVLKIALTCVQANPEKRPSMRHVAESLDRL